MDVHIPWALTEQLRLREVDVLATTEELTNEIPDDELLDLASEKRRMLVTSDVRFRVLAEDWQRQGRPFAGLPFFPALTHIGKLVELFVIIATASDSSEWTNSVVWLPFP
jgi:hypothetical protein